MTFLLLSALLFADTPSEPDQPSDSTDTAQPGPDSEADQEPSPQIDTSTSSETVIEGGGEIIIYGERELAQKRGLLDSQLQDQGYTVKKRTDDRTVYRPVVYWKPSVIIYDEGYMIIRRSPFRMEPWVGGKKGNKLRYLSCIPPFTILCMRSGWLVSNRKLEHSKTKIVEESTPSLEAWQAVVFALSTENRLQNEIPKMLDELWFDGLNIDNQDEIISTQDERRERIVQFWESRSCTPEGERARLLVEDYILYEVQRSESPFGTQEIAGLDNTSCGHVLGSRLTENINTDK